MNPSAAAVIEFLRSSFSDTQRWPRWPKPLHLIQGALVVESGATVADAAKVVGTTEMRLMEVVTAADPVETVLRVTEADLKNDAMLSYGGTSGSSSLRVPRRSRFRRFAKLEWTRANSR